jgi:hypothetical protein
LSEPPRCWARHPEHLHGHRFGKNITHTLGTPFSKWMADNYPELTGDDAKPGAGPDHDSVNNLLEFALAGSFFSGSQGVANWRVGDPVISMLPEHIFCVGGAATVPQIVICE